MYANTKKKKENQGLWKVFSSHGVCVCVCSFIPKDTKEENHKIRVLGIHKHTRLDPYISCLLIDVV